jgi:hypothetical protein
VLESMTSFLKLLSPTTTVSLAMVICFNPRVAGPQGAS